MSDKGSRSFAAAITIVLFTLAGCGAGSGSIENSVNSQLFLYNITAHLEFERGETSYAAASYSKALDRARIMNDTIAIADAAYNLGICRGALGDYGGASAVLEEAEWEAIRAGIGTTNILLVESRLALMQHNSGEARRLSLAVLMRADAKPVDAQRLAAHVLIGLAGVQEGDLPSAQSQLDQAKTFSAKATDPISQAVLAGLSGEIHFLSREFASAATDFDHQAQLSQQGRDYRTMIHALVKAGRSAAHAGNKGQAADRLYRAARAAIAAHTLDAESLANEARAAAIIANDSTLIHLTSSLAAPSTRPALP